MATTEQAVEELPKLRAQLQDARDANALLRTELEMLERWYQKLEPCSPVLLPPSETHDGQQLQTRGRSKSRLLSAMNYSVGLTVEQKCELAQRELTEVKEEIQRIKKDSEQTLQNLEAVIEEADVWRTDIKNAIRDFENNISSAISSNKGGITASEKLLRYLEEKNRQRDLLREKLHLKNSLLKGYKKKLQQQLKQKEEMGETLREVHLQHLQARNAEYQEKIAEKNQELLQLKVASRKTMQALNFYKRKLQIVMETSSSLMKDISQRKELLEKIERETAVVEKQRADAERVNRLMLKQLSDFSVPSVLSYVQKKMAVTDLKSSLKAWERKVAVAEMSLQSYHKARNQVKMSGDQLL